MTATKAAKKPFFLICNDDGVHAAGIRALAAAVTPVADWVIVAPNIERSGAGQGITLTMPLRLEQLASNIYSVEGTPADCVMMAMHKVLTTPPDLLLSGINRGANIGQDTLYSGTVAAAMEGCLRGVPAIALSLAQRNAYSEADYSEAVQVVLALLARPELMAAAAGGVLNVNIPARPAAAMAGFSVCTLGRRLYDHQIVEGTDPRGRPFFWIGGGGDDHSPLPGSDCVQLAAGFVTLTVLKPDHADARLNDTLLSSLESACGIFSP